MSLTAPLPKYARVLVNISARALNRPFTYAVPTELATLIKVGSIVEAPFRNGQLVGFVVFLDEQLTADAEGHDIKPLTKVLDDTVYWGDELMKLTRFMSRYYGCLWLEALQAALPGPVLKKVVGLLKRKRPLQAKAREKKLDIITVPTYASFTLTAQQERAVQAIEESCCGGPPVLLYGVTGSGKTEVYLQAVERCLKRGRQAVVLVPELSLTQQAIERYRGRLGNTVGVLHSGLSDTERQAYWWAMHQGDLQVALGTRSAIFAPLHDIGLFVIDEEHENSYKQENAPRYHARQIAYKRAQYHRAGTVYGSATPSFESYYAAQNGMYRLVEMSERPQGHSLPDVHLVDMRCRGKNQRMISLQLAEAIRQRVADGQQTVLYLNRRGFSNYLQCSECGNNIGCPHCSIPLTYHKIQRQMRCHYCGYAEAPPTLCPVCQGCNFRHGGGGTERLLHEVEALVPGVKIARMDRDTTGKVGAHERILSEFASGEAQILLGTKMITKGLDYPNVTLVGVINGDDELNMPDFRAAERCFQLITQVSGRAGRGDLAGEVFLQVRNPEQLAVQAALKNDFTALYDAEIVARQKLLYPPFCRLLRALVVGQDEVTTASMAAQVAEYLRSQKLPAKVIGPAPCPMERLQGKYRYHIILKCAALQPVVDSLSAKIDWWASHKKIDKVSIVIDPEPQSLS